MEKVKAFFEFRENINQDVLNQIENNRNLLDSNIDNLDEIKILFSENHDELNSIFKLLE